MPAPTFNRWMDAMGSASRFIPPILRGIRPVAPAVWGSEYLSPPIPDMPIGIAGGEHTAPAGDASAFALEQGDVDAWVLWWNVRAVGNVAYTLNYIQNPVFYKANRATLNTQQSNPGAPTRRVASRGDMELAPIIDGLPNFDKIDTAGSGTVPLALRHAIFVPRNVALHWWVRQLNTLFAVTWSWVELPRDRP